MAFWINFAKTGNPNDAGLPTWLPFNEKDQAAMVFDNTSVGIRPLPNIEKVKVLDQHYERLIKQVK